VLETSSLPDIANPQQPDLNWHVLADQPTGKITNALVVSRSAEMRDGQASFPVAPADDCRSLRQRYSYHAATPTMSCPPTGVRQSRRFAGVGGTQAAAIVQRRLADTYQMRTIIDKVAEMERLATKRHRPMEYPKIGKLLSWFPNPRAPDKKRKPPRVTAVEAHIEELGSVIEVLHA
jgi:hypothetical protein